MVNQELFIKFSRVYAFQPATAFWRPVEVDILKKFIPFIEHCRDLGCGDGKLTAILFDGRSLVGIDGDAYETQQAPRSLPYRKTSQVVYLEEPDRRLAHYRYWDINERQAILANYGLILAHKQAKGG